jgi:hypothetical protein
MAVSREPGDQGRPSSSDDEQRLRTSMANELPPRRSSLDDDLYGDLQADPEMAEGRASYGRIAIYAVAALLVVCAVLYGMSQNDTNTASNGTSQSPSVTTSENASKPPLPPVRDVTPGPNSQPGTTTGAAPNAPATPAPKTTNPPPAKGAGTQ